jgi:hypothetical protein
MELPQTSIRRLIAQASSLLQRRTLLPSPGERASTPAGPQTVGAELGVRVAAGGLVVGDPDPRRSQHDGRPGGAPLRWRTPPGVRGRVPGCAQPPGGGRVGGRRRGQRVRFGGPLPHDHHAPAWERPYGAGASRRPLARISENATSTSLGEQGQGEGPRLLRHLPPCVGP